jgi:hypothetical protein
MINDKARALTEQIESSVNALAAETDAVRKSETFLNWLNAMAQFHSYSWNNQFLISIQCPGASKVAGFQTWKKLGRNVKKGAKGIAILAPCLYRRKADPENEDSPTVQKLGGFKVAYVFDYSATEGEPLPALQYAAAAGGEDLLPKLEAAAGKLAVQLEYLEIPEQGVQGYSTGGKIVIRQSLSTASTCAVIAHELGHNADFRFMPSRSAFPLHGASDRARVSGIIRALQGMREERRRDDIALVLNPLKSLDPMLSLLDEGPHGHISVLLLQTRDQAKGQ